jgi:hypothetical protein
VPETVAGRAGLSPYTFLSASSRISARRHRHSDLLVMRLPLSFRNGSGSRELEGIEPGTVTGQSAPSSSTARMLTSATAVFVTTIAVPVTARAAIASMTSAERILEEPESRVTGALLPVEMIDDPGCRYAQESSKLRTCVNTFPESFGNPLAWRGRNAC